MAGDLSSTIDAQGRDEVADLLRALSEMVQQPGPDRQHGAQQQRLHRHRLSQVATGNADLSQRTEEQASALQQTAHHGRVGHHRAPELRQSARTANDLAQNASDIAARGGSVVSQVVDTMRGIDQASKKIADIIGVIDGIAFRPTSWR